MKYLLAIIVIALAIFGFSYFNKDEASETAVIEGTDLTTEETATTTDETMTASALLSGTTTTSIEASAGNVGATVGATTTIKK
ncbi:MAG: hypothetical protein RJA61_232 [Candidatus Parcubacteria bacterium]|jgi:hypothetical protein